MTGVFKLLIADRETLLARRMSDYLLDKGFSCEFVNGGKQLKEALATFQPDFVMSDLLLPECTASELLKIVKSHPALIARGTKVFVTSSHNNIHNVRKAFSEGAADYIIKPYRDEDILNRLVFHLQKKHEMFARKPGERASAPNERFLTMTDVVLKEATSFRDPREKLFNITQMLGMVLKGVRCSVVKCDVGTLRGLVVASSDDLRVKGIKLDLNKYPEILYTINTGKYVAMENIDYNPELAKLKKIVKTISFNSIVVCPIFLHGEIYGIMSTRMDSKVKIFEDVEVQFAQSMARIASLIVNSADFEDLTFESIPDAVAA